MPMSPFDTFSQVSGLFSDSVDGLVKLVLRGKRIGVIGPDQTIEALAISIDPTNGVDPTSTMRIDTQEAATAYGAFKTHAGAIACLPVHIRHLVRLSYVAGSYTITDAHFGSYARFTFGDAGQIILDGGALVDATGAVTSTISSVGAGDTDGVLATLVADPSYTADAYAGYFARVTGGTGLGAANDPYRTIAKHTTTAWKLVGGSLGWDATTTIKPSAPATKLTWDGSSTINLFGANSRDPSRIVFQGLWLVAPGTKQINACGLAATWHLVRVEKARFTGGQRLNGSATEQCRVPSIFELGLFVLDGVSGNTANSAFTTLYVSCGVNGPVVDTYQLIGGAYFANWARAVSNVGQYPGHFGGCQMANVTFGTMTNCVRGGSRSLFIFGSNTRAINGVVSDTFIIGTLGSYNFEMNRTFAIGASGPTGVAGFVRDALGVTSAATIDAATGDYIVGDKGGIYSLV